MKRTFLPLLLGFAITTGTVLAEQNVVSRPVGVVQLKFPEKAQSLVSIPLQPFSNTLEGALVGLTGSTNESTADTLYKWDAIVSEYKRAFKTDGKWVSDFATLSNSDLTLSPGEGFFIENRQGVTQSVFVAGRIVLDATNTIILYPGLNLAGYPYSTAGADPMGQGRWESNTTGVERIYIMTRPYADVFPAEGSLPAITGIHAVPTGDVMIASLSIQCAGTMLDIFYKDLAATDVFESERGWLIAESDIKVKDTTTLEWVDQGADARPAINEIFARYYIVARADVDEDGNGIPDAREQFVFGASKSKAGSSLLSSTNGILSESTEKDLSDTNAPSFHQPLPVLLGRIIYIHKKTGNNAFSGKMPYVFGSDGPKKTIKAGLGIAQSGDAIVIKEGHYGEDLNIAGRNVSVTIEGNVDLSGSSVDTPVVQRLPPMTNVLGVVTNGF